MFFGIDPVTIGVSALIWYAFRQQSGKNYGVLTPEREEVYRNALEFCGDPERLNRLSAAFQKEGLKAEAWTLRQRAKWRARTPEQRKVHADIYEKALVSENIAGILKVASAFEALTATNKAKILRERAQMLNERNLRELANAGAKEVAPAAPAPA